MTDKNFQLLVRYVDGDLSEIEKIEAEELILTSPSNEYFVQLNELVQLKKTLGGSISLNQYLENQTKKIKQLLSSK